MYFVLERGSMSNKDKHRDKEYKQFR